LLFVLNLNNNVYFCLEMEDNICHTKIIEIDNSQDMAFLSLLKLCMNSCSKKDKCCKKHKKGKRCKNCPKK
jgi:hypothetical protein